MREIFQLCLYFGDAMLVDGVIDGVKGIILDGQGLEKPRGPVSSIIKQCPERGF